MMSSLEPQIILSGRGLVECPRWHDGSFWFADWTAGEILRIREDLSAQVVAKGAAPPLSFDFASDGTMLVVEQGATALQRLNEDGELTAFAEFRDAGWNEIVVDGRGNTYVNGPQLMLVKADGQAVAQASDFAFPNGMAVLADHSTLIIAESHGHRLTAFDIGNDGSLSNRRLWAQLGEGTPDGICADETGAIWYADVPNRCCRRVAEGGRVLDDVHLDRGGFACMLGGSGRRTLLITAATWFGMDRMGETAGTGELLTIEAAHAGAGYP